MIIHNTFIALLSMIICFSCQSQHNEPSQNTNCLKAKVDNPSLRRLLVLNEGNFQWGLSSLQVFQWNDSGKINLISSDLYQCQTGKPLGNVGQSFFVDSAANKLFAVINNSGKITVWDYKTLGLICELKGLSSPRYMTRVGDSYVVSDLYSGCITQISVNDWNQRRQLRIGGWIEELQFDPNSGYLFASRIARTGQVSNLNCLVVLRMNDNNQLNIIDSFPIPNGYQIVGKPIYDPLSKKWAVYTSKENSLIDSVFYGTVDSGKVIFQKSMGIKYPDKMGVTRRVEFDLQHDQGIVLNDNGYVQKGLASAIRLNNSNLVSIKRLNIPNNHGVLYGAFIVRTGGGNTLGFISDAGNYVTPGKVYAITHDGTVVGQVSTGVIPQAMSD